MGFDVKRGKSGDNAIALIHAISRAKDAKFPELLIIDWNMPIPDGPRTLESLLSMYKKNEQATPLSIMMIQGPSTLIQQKTMERLGVKAVLTKPFTLKALNNTLEEVLFTEKLRPKKVQKSTGFSELVSHLKGEKILLVEDNEVNQLVASRILRKAGFVVHIAGNGKIAVEEVQKDKYALVLMDIQMPEMDGIEATKKIRAIPGFDKIPIVAMTAHAMSSDRDMSLQAGMNDHISKPIDVQELFKKIAIWLNPLDSDSEAFDDDNGSGHNGNGGGGHDGASGGGHMEGHIEGRAESHVESHVEGHVAGHVAGRDGESEDGGSSDTVENSSGSKGDDKGKTDKESLDTALSDNM
jgi:two-component system sensor histidine kinase/response regulator